MNLLLDTHVALWTLVDSPRLSNRARDLIQATEATIWVSVASLWEITIKHALGRGDMSVSGSDALRYFEASGFKLLAIEPVHVIEVGRLPPHHQDPFDRLLIAQALIEPMRLLTHDDQIVRYSDAIVKV